MEVLIMQVDREGFGFGGNMGRRFGMGRAGGLGFGNMYRFLIPVVAVSLSKLGKAHGYQVAQEAAKLSVTDTVIDQAAVYRSLRRLDMMGLTYSEWDTTGSGPARRIYMLSEEGIVQLESWMARMKKVATEIEGLLRAYESISPKTP
jgi:PadR family transcriptional regulator PadR